MGILTVAAELQLYPPYMRKAGWLVGCIITVLTISQCAHQVPPPGGPPDTTAPQVVETVPTSGTVRWQQPEVLIRFSEDVFAEQFASAVRVFPEDNVQIRWQEEYQVLQLLFDSLRENQTYVITIAPRFRDEAGNLMAQPFTLAFSTGEHLSQRSIVGQVVNAVPERTIVLLSAESTKWEDSHWYQEPQYQLNVGSNGIFEFPALPPAKYRIAAFIDRNSNARFDSGKEAQSVGWREIDLTQVVHDTVMLWMSAEPDVQPPSLLGVTPLSSQRIRIRFSEPLDSVSIGDATIVCIRNDSRDTVVAIGAGLEAGKQTAILAVFDQAFQPGEWLVYVQDIRDTAGNVVDSSSLPGQFRSIVRLDTVVPRVISIPVPDSIRLVQPFFRWTIAFTTPMDTVTVQQAVRCSLLSSQALVPLQFRWKGQTMVELLPHDTLQWNQGYELILDTTAKDVLQRSLSQRYQWRFFTPDWRVMGSLAGSIAVDTARGPLIVIAIGRQYQVRYQQVVQNRQWKIVSMVPDWYQVWCFEDWNRNGTLDCGSIDPYQHSERFVRWDEPIRVAPRWESTGVIFRFPQLGGASQ